MTLPPGFRSTLFAAEPDVRQPIGFTIDHRGRLWVAESFSYPFWLQAPTEPDRIVILEDTDGNGQFDRRTIFWDRGGKIANITGLALGFGGVWACATPNLVFIPDADGDDRPDGEPVVVLDGWDTNARHNLFNALTWGPDGWLYGCNGILSNSRVGTPGTPDAARVSINCGVWRYHPTRKAVEAVAHGTTNPWGLDFNDVGEAFITNCVIPHLFHVVPGAHFQRMFGQDMSDYSFSLLPSIADHIHWAGGHWTDSRGGQGKHSEAGGGHAHVGAMIYLGDNWPDRYRDTLLTCNVHGHRVNNDRIERSGSAYVAKHDADFLLANDDWFRGLELKYGPDGGVFVTDWSDTGECHETDGDLAHRENGRIYKITYGNVAPVKVDLARLSDGDLVSLQLHKNDWYVRTARRLLQERAAKGQDLAGARRSLEAMLETHPDVTRKLRALWALHVTGGVGHDRLLALLEHPSEYVRGWAVRLLTDEGLPAPDVGAKLAARGVAEPSAWVRLALASALQRVATADRWRLAEGLLGHAEDSSDTYLPLMIWYGVEPLVSTDPGRAVDLLAAARIAPLRQFLARRLVLLDDAPLARLSALLEKSDDTGAQLDILAGVYEGLKARKTPARPLAWDSAFVRLSASQDRTVRERAALVGLRLDDPKAVERLRETLLQASAPADERSRALSALSEHRVPGLSTTLLALLDDQSVRTAAVRGLAAYDDPTAFQTLVDRYSTFSESDRADVVQTLALRPGSARILLDALGRGVIPKRDLQPTTARQLQALKDPKIAETLANVWGSIRPTSREKSALIAKYKAMLTSERKAQANLSRGRSVFNRTCVQCHRVFDTGGDVGPDLTGSDRANLDYILENVLDPSAQVAREYKLTTIATVDGRLLSGIVRESTPKAVVLQTVNERLTLPREEIDDLKLSNVSMMPEGLLEKLTPDEINDLVAYLAAKQQIAAAPDSSAGH